MQRSLSLRDIQDKRNRQSWEHRKSALMIGMEQLIPLLVNSTIPCREIRHLKTAGQPIQIVLGLDENWTSTLVVNFYTKTLTIRLPSFAGRFLLCKSSVNQFRNLK